MRNRGDVLTGLIREYLEPAFTKRVAEVNEEDPDIRLRDVSIWLSGHSAVLTGLPDYPACIILVDGRTLRDPYTTEYRVSVGIGITADDPAYLERLGRAWEDILEDAIRSDWSLGGAVLDVDTGVSFTVGQVSGLYVIEADMTVQVDIGGFVYLPEVTADEEPDEEVGDEEAVLKYLSSLDGGLVLGALASALSAYPSSDVEGLQWITNIWDTTGQCQMLFNVSSFPINSNGMTVTGLLNFILVGTLDEEGVTMTITGYRLYSASVTFGGGDKTVAVTNLDAVGSLTQSFIATANGIYVGGISGYEGAEFEAPTTGSFAVDGETYEIGGNTESE